MIIFDGFRLFWTNSLIFQKKISIFDYFCISLVTYLVWVLHKANRLLVYCLVHLSSARYIPHRQGFSYNSIPVRFDIWIIQSGLGFQYSRDAHVGTIFKYSSRTLLNSKGVFQNNTMVCHLERSGIHGPGPTNFWKSQTHSDQVVRGSLEEMVNVTFLGHDHEVFLHTFFRRSPISLSG